MKRLLLLQGFTVIWAVVGIFYNEKLHHEAQPAAVSQQEVIEIQQSDSLTTEEIESKIEMQKSKSLARRAQF